MIVTIEVQMPNHGKRLASAMQVSEHVFRDSFAPLPRERELDFAIDAQERAARQQSMRRAIARTMAEQLAVKLLEMIESEDPQHGYSPEEWRQMNAA